MKPRVALLAAFGLVSAGAIVVLAAPVQRRTQALNICDDNCTSKCALVRRMDGVSSSGLGIGPPASSPLLQGSTGQANLKQDPINRGRRPKHDEEQLARWRTAKRKQAQRRKDNPQAPATLAYQQNRRRAGLALKTKQRAEAARQPAQAARQPAQAARQPAPAARQPAKTQSHPAGLPSQQDAPAAVQPQAHPTAHLPEHAGSSATQQHEATGHLTETEINDGRLWLVDNP